MKTKITTLLLLIGLIHTGDQAFCQEAFPEFDKIRITNSSAVKFIKSTEHNVLVDGKEQGESMKYFTQESKGWIDINGIEADNIVVYAPTLKRVEIISTGKFYSDDMIVGDELELEVAGIGKLDIDVKVEELDLVVSGSGKIILEGTATNLDAEINGAAKIVADKLVVQNADIEISGAGKVVVDVREVLNADISGAGVVNYVSEPKVVRKEISGVGAVGEGTITTPDTTRITIGDKKVIIIDEGEIKIKRSDGYVKGHWAGFEMGINLLMDDNFSTDTPEGYDFLKLKESKSVAVNLNLIDHEVKLHGRHIMFITGLGFSWNNYRFSSDLYLDPESSKVQPVNDSLTYAKNKLVVSYLNVPLLFEFNTSEYRKHSVHFAFGAIVGLRLGSHVKLVREDGNDRYKKKIYDSFNLNPMKYDATVRLGFRNFTVFGNYSLGNLFKSSKDPELHPLTVGIRLVGW